MYLIISYSKPVFWLSSFHQPPKVLYFLAYRWLARLTVPVFRELSSRNIDAIPLCLRHTGWATYHKVHPPPRCHTYRWVSESPHYRDYERCGYGSCRIPSPPFHPDYRVSPRQYINKVYLTTTVGLIPDGMHRLSGFAIKDCKQFGTSHNATSRIAIIGSIVQFSDSGIRRLHRG